MKISKKKGLILLSTLCLGLSNAAFAIEKSNVTTAEAQTQNAPERTMPLAAYQQDLSTFQNTIEVAAVKALENAQRETNITPEKEMQNVINDSKALTNSIKELVLKTPEGKKVQTTFIAFNNDGIQLLLAEPKWRNDQALQNKLVEQSTQLNQELLQAILDLQILAEE